ncbi:MAG TPA: hypothetical protein VFJ47_01870 [Terriglobales bacterium]|nr:hypothetical protein [Terriglobales bacterium]
MVSRCANPACAAPFRYLHEGRLFQIERRLDRTAADHSEFPDDPGSKRPASQVEFFWLCKNCSLTMTLVFEKGTGVVTRPLRHMIRAAS